MNFREFLLTESKQEIIGLGYPPLIASMFYEKFGKLAFLFARWYRDFKSYTQDRNWWRQTQNSSLIRDVSIDDLIRLYYAADSPEEYEKALRDLEWTVDDKTYDPTYLWMQKRDLKKQIEEKFFGETFFNYYSLVKDITSGQLKDLAPYRDLNYWEAQKKYDEKRVFQDQLPIKTYPNGNKWINVGKRCYLVGKLMRNCGSAGMMSLDKDGTMIVLFDKNNKPHVVVTYSPNENRISGDEGGASTEVKTVYHKYVLDLANFLGATFDADRSKSKFLAAKWKLRGRIADIQKLRGSSNYTPLYQFTTHDGARYYTDGNTVVSEEDVKRLKDFPFRNKLGSLVGNVLNVVNMQQIAAQDPSVYVPISRFAEPSAAV